jgi:DNA-binding MltR family transcriptional regulator
MSGFSKRLKALQNSEFDAIVPKLKDLDDRSMVLTLVAYLEDMLAFTIATRFLGNMTMTTLSNIFTGYGPLSTMSVKIAIGKAMSIIDHETSSDIEVIKSIRNDCAHVYQEVSFSNDDFVNRYSRLKDKGALSNEEVLFLENAPPARREFARTVIRLIVKLHVQMAVSDSLRAIYKRELADIKTQLRDKMEAKVKRETSQ